jgi:hypothetical protein
VSGVPPENLAETDLLRELEHLHTTLSGSETRCGALTCTPRVLIGHG